MYPCLEDFWLPAFYIVSFHFILACTVSAKKSGTSLMGVPLYMILGFYLASFNSLSLTSVSFIMIYLGVDHFRLLLFGALFASWIWILFPSPSWGIFQSLFCQIYFLFFSCSLLFLGPL